ncbi:MAG: hypothetical protein CM15mP75_3630 [Flammeovirgaceae bacterium]|nr:MAG: hypothetical protein CM15mP75_3630 [Flammeovirgaceae bacterium]
MTFFDNLLFSKKEIMKKTLLFILSIFIVVSCGEEGDSVSARKEFIPDKDVYIGGILIIPLDNKLLVTGKME